MRRIFLFLSLFFFSINAEAKITIFACEPEWRSLAAEITRGQAEIYTATSDLENPVFLRSGQNFFNTNNTNKITDLIRNADLVFCTGGGLEDAWLPGLIKNSSNEKIQNDSSRILYAINYVTRPTPGEMKVDNPALKANPRPHLNPHNLIKISAELLRRLKTIDPQNADLYQKNYRDFYQRWIDAIAVWEKAAKPLRGMSVVVRDDSWLELTNWLGLKVIARTDVSLNNAARGLELQKIASDLKDNPPQLIIVAYSESKDAAKFLKERFKSRVIEVPLTVGGASSSGDLFKMFRNIVGLMLDECSTRKCSVAVYPRQK